ncbi:NUDIX domain-containing protein [Micromonospora citrea]|uniref:NUDIX domain-containing protein n=1 Tax=Micromonospora citrea TaxID=47855 RepID=UPI003C4723F2
MVTANEMPPMATPRVAAGALFFDDEGRVLLVRPNYKEHWDIPGGYVEPGESPRSACIREIREELNLNVDIGSLLVVDWAPVVGEGDKILFIFDAGVLSDEDQHLIAFVDGEIEEWRFAASDEIHGFLPNRLARRIRVAIAARQCGRTAYAEHGSES